MGITVGSIERRGDAQRVKVSAGLDPLTGRPLYLAESTTGEAQPILNRFRILVDRLPDEVSRQGVQDQAVEGLVR
ncbi:hypothetical protein [Actinokineospora sp.]|uniref:hypothetical protein n=1 Tax=Actinokineospora sp. TaxID=1872133 RepID=UPI003D6A69A6